MKQITEDYVSYETAVLLKEKGFDVPTEDFYDTTGENLKDNKTIYGGISDFGKVNWNADPFVCEGFPKLITFSKPSQSLALKWLREVHEIHIDVFIGSDESYDADGVMADEWHFWTYYITNTSGDMIYDAYNDVDVIEYQTHEQAVEAALLYVLKNLI